LYTCNDFHIFCDTQDLKIDPGVHCKTELAICPAVISTAALSSDDALVALANLGTLFSTKDIIICISMSSLSNLYHE